MMQTNESKRDWGNFFTDSDMTDVYESMDVKNNMPSTNGLIDVALGRAVKTANEIIRKELEKAPRVYGWFDAERSFSSDGTDGSGSHTARLICIEEIKRDPIKPTNQVIP